MFYLKVITARRSGMIFMIIAANFFLTLLHKKIQHMSLLNNSNKNKKGSKPGVKQPVKPGLISGSKGKTNSKGVARNTKLTGGSQRGS